MQEFRYVSKPVIAALAALALLQGCAGAALTAGGVAGGAGVNHTLSGIVYKTFNTPVKELRQATLRSLDSMEVEVTHDAVAEYGWEIKGKAFEREIDIELERLTPATTRMRVVTSEGFLFKDSATSTEIIQQTATRLDTATATANSR